MHTNGQVNAYKLLEVRVALEERCATSIAWQGESIGSCCIEVCIRLVYKFRSTALNSSYSYKENVLSFLLLLSKVEWKIDALI